MDLFGVSLTRTQFQISTRFVLTKFPCFHNKNRPCERYPACGNTHTNSNVSKNTFYIFDGAILRIYIVSDKFLLNPLPSP